jgi:hypothetical protein
LIGKYRDTLLIAILCDANNKLVPLTFALVERENNDSWGWFLRLVRIHVVGPSREVGIISDRHQGILNVVREEIEGYAVREEIEGYATGRYEVKHTDGTTSDGEVRESRIHVVILQDFSCTCGKLRQYHFVCSHLVAAARHHNYNIEARIPHEFSVDTLVRTWRPRFMPFRDPGERLPYDGPTYVADLAYR